MVSQAPPRPLTVVVGIDFSELSDQALKVAKNFADRWSPAVIHAVHVVPQLEIDSPIPALRNEVAKEGLERLQEYLKERGYADMVQARAVVGAASAVLPEVARSVHADLIVVGTHGRKGLARLVMGSVAETVMREAPCSVLVVRERELSPEELIQPARPGQDVHEHHARARTHHESPNAASSGYGMGALTFRP
jgi:nucleotide-binding universal stress UspA family protein